MIDAQQEALRGHQYFFAPCILQTDVKDKSAGHALLRIAY